MLLKEDLKRIIESEKFSIKNNTTIKFDDLKESVYDRIINAKKYSGLKVRSKFRKRRNVENCIEINYSIFSGNDFKCSMKY